MSKISFLILIKRSQVIRTKVIREIFLNVNNVISISTQILSKRGHVGFMLVLCWLVRIPT